MRQQELIETDADSRSEIELNDRTKLALGPGSRLLLDKFVYDPDISGGAIVMNLVKGTFRFITGIAVKPAYVIRTPAASITVRGTIFDVFVQNANETWLLLIEGGVEVCTQSGKCLVHDEPGKLIRITADDVEKPAKWSQTQGQAGHLLRRRLPVHRVAALHRSHADLHARRYRARRHRG